jgi:hypothetical protein
VTTWLSTSCRTQLRATDEPKTFSGRARREQLATGETVRKRTVEMAEELTPREAQIARLAWDGRASPEVSTQLFTGPRPAGWHPRTAQSSKPRPAEFRSRLPR